MRQSRLCPITALCPGSASQAEPWTDYGFISWILYWSNHSAQLPHRATLSRFLASVDASCLEAFRTLFEQHSFAQGWTNESIGGIWDRQGHRYLVFDVDATRQAARQRALPCDPSLPPPRRRFDAVCAPGYTGRKRGEVVRTRTVALQMHTRQWIGTYAGQGNGD